MAPGSFFSAVGSYQEEEFEVVRRSDLVVVDGLEHVLHRETPVIALMIKQGLLERERVLELGPSSAARSRAHEPAAAGVLLPIAWPSRTCAFPTGVPPGREKGIGTRLSLL